MWVSNSATLQIPNMDITHKGQEGLFLRKRLRIKGNKANYQLPSFAGPGVPDPILKPDALNYTMRKGALMTDSLQRKASFSNLRPSALKTTTPTVLSENIGKVASSSHLQVLAYRLGW